MNAKDTNGENDGGDAGSAGGDHGGGDHEGAGERTRRERVTDALHAFRESLEETIAEARDRGDLSAEKAKEIMRTAADRAREATAEAREKFDFVTQAEFDELSARVSRLETKLAERLGPATGEGGSDD